MFHCLDCLFLAGCEEAVGSQTLSATPGALIDPGQSITEATLQSVGQGWDASLGGFGGRGKRA
jgi:hypothetical protein